MQTETEQWCIAYYAPSGRHPLHDGLVWSRRPPSSRTRRNQYDAAGVFACAQRRNDFTLCNGIDMSPRGRLRTYMTSHIQPEVHNVSQRREMRTGPRPEVTCTSISVKTDLSFWRYARGQTNRHTDGPAYLSTPLQLEVWSKDVDQSTRRERRTREIAWLVGWSRV